MFKTIIWHKSKDNVGKETKPLKSDEWCLVSIA